MVLMQQFLQLMRSVCLSHHHCLSRKENIQHDLTNINIKYSEKLVQKLTIQKTISFQKLKFSHYSNKHQAVPLSNQIL